MPEPATDDNQPAPLSSTFPLLQGDLGPGRVLGNRYRLVAYMGSGSSARVYLAEDRSLGRRVAVKCLRAGLTGDYRFLRRFRAEAKAAAQLSHPNILAVHDWGEDASAAYLVTEVLLGGSLRDLIGRSDKPAAAPGAAPARRLSPSQGLLVALQVGQGLSYAHGRGWVHRDVKPANLLFGKDGRLRVADFGLARALAEATWTEPEGVLVGTARYAAPEQASGRGIGGWTDVYSLAVTLAEAVTGRVPLLAENALGTMMLRQEHDLVEDMGQLHELGPLGPVLAVAGRADPVSRPSAPQLVELLRQAARTLPRPERLPLVEFTPPGPPVGMTIIDLREVRDDPDPTGPPAHGLHSLRLTAAQLAQARRTAAERAAARQAGGGDDPAPAAVGMPAGHTVNRGTAPVAAGVSRWAELDAGFTGGQIRTRPRPMPVGLTRRPPGPTPNPTPTPEPPSAGEPVQPPARPEPPPASDRTGQS